MDKNSIFYPLHKYFWIKQALFKEHFIQIKTTSLTRIKTAKFPHLVNVPHKGRKCRELALIEGRKRLKISLIKGERPHRPIRPTALLTSCSATRLPADHTRQTAAQVIDIVGVQTPPAVDRAAHLFRLLFSFIGLCKARIPSLPSSFHPNRTL